MNDFNLLDQLEASFNQEPVSIIDFAQSSKYCNRVLYPRQRLLLKLIHLEELDPEEERILEFWEKGGRNGSEIEIGPGIRERMETLKGRGYKHFREVVLVGGRRCSKGFITGLSMAKQVFDLVQLQDPGQHYGIDQDKEIVFACVAASQDQAQDMQYADFSAMVNSCQALQRNIFKLQELEFSLMTETDIRKIESWKRQGRRIQRDISKIRGKALPANSRTIRGLTAMCVVFDEFAHFMQGESDQSDESVYSAATPALAQFGRDALIFANSSPFSKIGKFFERYEVGMAVENDNPVSPEVLAIRLPSWALFQGWWEDPDYMGPKKCITVSPDWDPDKRNKDGSFFYTEDDRQAILIERNTERDNPQAYKVERRGYFAEVIDAYLIPEMVDRMFMGRPTTFDAENDRWVYQSMRTNWNDSTYMLKYYGHLDPSSTTAGFGFALGHVEEMEINQRTERHVLFDIIKRWNPKDFENGVIDWDPILEEVLYIAEIFRPQQISFDQFNSDFPITWLRKMFRKNRIETRVFQKQPTSQSNWDRAEIFRTALYRGLIHAPNDTADCHWAGQELKFLQEIKSARIPRVEKQDNGPVQTKDMADCAMEVVEATIGDIMAIQQREDLGSEAIRAGAPGGYQIGGPDRGGNARPSPFQDFYATRAGEQRMPGAARAQRGGSGGRTRGLGGRPVPRRLPGW